MSEAQICADLTRKIGDQLDVILQRELALAQVVLSVSGVSAVYLEVVTRLSAAAVATAVAGCRPEFDPGEMYDDVAAHLAEKVRGVKPESLAALARLKAA